MDPNQLLDTVSYAGKLMIQSGAEIYRVEETMVRLCRSFEEVKDAESFVTPTGIMFSITISNTTYTKILRVHSRGVDLNCIDQINDLSRRATTQSFSNEELALELKEIAQGKRYSFPVILFFGALSAAGFALFFEGSYLDGICAFFIGIVIKLVSWLMEQREFNSFFTNAIAAGMGAVCALLFHEIFKSTDVDIMIIASIMLLVPGLAITNALRDSVAGDYLSGVARMTEAFLVAIAIAAGIGFVLSLSIGMNGGV
ncbi:MAG: threonine/serine exporter family protein [Longicatena sp.]